MAVMMGSRLLPDLQVHLRSHCQCLSIIMVMMSRPIFSSLRHKDGGDGNRRGKREREREREREAPRTSEAVAVDPALLGDRSLKSASVSQRERGSSSTILLLQKLVISLAEARTAAAAAMAAAAVGVCRESMEVPRLLQQRRLRSSHAQGPSNGSQTCCCFITAARMGFGMLQTHDDTLFVPGAWRSGRRSTCRSS